MTKRASKQIKLTDKEYSLMQRHVDVSEQSTQKAFLETVLDRYIQVQNMTLQVEFLIPAKSGRCRTFWIDSGMVKNIKRFAEYRDVSENAVMYTAVKRYLIDTKEVRHA